MTPAYNDKERFRTVAGWCELLAISLLRTQALVLRFASTSSQSEAIQGLRGAPARRQVPAQPLNGRKRASTNCTTHALLRNHLPVVLVSVAWYSRQRAACRLGSQRSTSQSCSLHSSFGVPSQCSRQMLRTPFRLTTSTAASMMAPGTLTCGLPGIPGLYSSPIARHGLQWSKSSYEAPVNRIKKLLRHPYNQWTSSCGQIVPTSARMLQQQTASS
jgi:hypothetical protein